MTTFLVTGASCHSTFNCMKSRIRNLKCKKVQSSIEKFHWSKKLRKTENFSFNLNIKVLLESVNLYLHVFLCQGHFDNRTLHEVAHNFHLKIRNILELTTCPVKFGTTCPSVIFLLVTGSRPPCLRYFLLTSPRIR